MKKQLELELGEIINNPTPMTKVMLLSQRPHWHTPEVEKKIYLKLAKLIVIVGDETPKEAAEDCKERFNKFNEFDNSYEVSNFLINTIYCDDKWIYELRDDIDFFCSQAQSILSKEIKEWVNYWNIIPPVKVGEKIMISKYPNFFGYTDKPLGYTDKPLEYLITKIKEDEAKVVAYEIGGKYTEQEALEKKAGYIFTYEQIIVTSIISIATTEILNREISDKLMDGLEKEL